MSRETIPQRLSETGHQFRRTTVSVHPMLFDSVLEPRQPRNAPLRDRLTTTPQQTDTDLHLSLSDRCGNHQAAVERTLDVLQAADIGTDKSVGDLDCKGAGRGSHRPRPS